MNGLTDLNRMSVVSFKGSLAWQLIPVDPSISRHEATSARAMVAMLRAGRADVALGVRQTLAYGLRQLGLKGEASEGFGQARRIGALDAQLWVRPAMPEDTVQRLAQALKDWLRGEASTQLRQLYLGERKRLPGETDLR